MAISKPKGANYTTGGLFDVQLALFIIQDTINFKVFLALFSHSFRNLEGERMKVEHGKQAKELAIAKGCLALDFQG